MNRLVKATMVVAVASLLAGMAYEHGASQPKGRLVTEQFVVAPGDGIDTVAWRVIEKSSVRRDVREVRAGILEQNYDKLKGRPEGLIHPGETLTVSYWKQQ